MSASRSSSRALTTSVRRLAGSSRIASATSIGRCPSNWCSSCATPWPGMASAEGVRPATFCQSTTCTVLRRPSLRWPRTATRVTIQSRDRICSMPRSTTTTSMPASCFEFGIVDPNPGVEHLAEHQHLAGALGESAQRHVGGDERHRLWFDRRDAQDGNENPSASEQFDDQAEHARLLTDDADADHDVADAAQRLAVGAQDHQPCEPGRVHPVDRRHDSKGRSECREHRLSTPSNLPLGSRQQPQDDRQGQGAARRRGVPRPRGRRGRRRQGLGPRHGGRGAGRARLGRSAARRAGQRLDHAVDARRRHRGGRRRRCGPGRDRAAEGHRRVARAGAGPAADPTGADPRPGGGPDRHRRPDRGCPRADQHRRHRRPSAGAGAGARPRRPDGEPEHAHPGRR